MMAFEMSTHYDVDYNSEARGDFSLINTYRK